MPPVCNAVILNINYSDIHTDKIREMWLYMLYYSILLIWEIITAESIQNISMHILAVQMITYLQYFHIYTVWFNLRKVTVKLHWQVATSKFSFDSKDYFNSEKGYFHNCVDAWRFVSTFRLWTNLRSINIKAGEGNIGSWSCHSEGEVIWDKAWLCL